MSLGSGVVLLGVSRWWLGCRWWGHHFVTVVVVTGVGDGVVVTVCMHHQFSDFSPSHSALAFLLSPAHSHPRIHGRECAGEIVIWPLMAAIIYDYISVLYYKWVLN